MSRGVLLIGNFNNRTSLEVYTNQRLYNEYVKQGVSVKCLDISGYNCPFGKVDTIKIDFNIERKGGGTGLRAYYCILLVLVKSMFKCGTYHYVTRACTRPSYSYMFLISFTGLILFKHVYFSFTADLYSFMGPLRSKWNGYPLAGISILMASKVFCDTELAYQTSLRFCPMKYKYEINRLPIASAEDLSKNNKLNNLFFISEDTRYIMDFLQMFCKNGSGEIVVVCSKHYKRTLVKDSIKDIIFIDENEPDSVKSFLTPKSRIFEPASCNGQLIFPDQLLLTSEIELLGNDVYASNTVSVIKCDDIRDSTCPYLTTI